MLNAEVAHSVVNDAHDVEVRVDNEVGNVAMDKGLAGLKTRNLLDGDTRVAAPDPEVFGLLTGGQAREEFGVVLLLADGPLAVVLKEPVVALCQVLLNIFIGRHFEGGRGGGGEWSARGGGGRCGGGCGGVVAGRLRT